MRVVKKGKDPDKLNLFTGDCRRCKGVFEADRGELEVEWDQREQGEFGRANCPNCGYEVIFYPKRD